MSNGLCPALQPGHGFSGVLACWRHTLAREGPRGAVPRGDVPASDRLPAGVCTPLMHAGVRLSHGMVLPQAAHGSPRQQGAHWHVVYADAIECTARSGRREAANKTTPNEQHNSEVLVQCQRRTRSSSRRTAWRPAASWASRTIKRRRRTPRPSWQVLCVQECPSLIDTTTPAPPVSRVWPSYEQLHTRDLRLCEARFQQPGTPLTFELRTSMLTVALLCRPPLSVKFLGEGQGKIQTGHANIAKRDPNPNRTPTKRLYP